MNLRHIIILMTTFAVISDAILIPFYPQFFAARYQLTSPVHAGAYVASISVAVMLTLPLWARVAKRVDAMHVLVYTQFTAGVFSMLSYWAATVPMFWVLSLAMFMCKSSYLLMYPYLIRLEKSEAHAHTIGLLSVVVRFGAIFGAVVGGFIMQTWGADKCIFAMAAGDFVQMFICMYLIRSHRISRRCQFALAEDKAQGVVKRTRPALRTRLPILRLSLLMLLFDFCAYLVRPFLSSYWQDVSGSSSELLSGLIFAIPGIVAIVALRLNRNAADRGKRKLDHLSANMLLGAAGLLLQGSGMPFWIVIGRCLYGWAIFQIVVKLDVTMFRLSTPASYAADYSVVNFFQNLGVLLASFAAGAIVQSNGLRTPFFIAAAGLLCTLLLNLLLDVEKAEPAPPIAEPHDTGVTASAN
jgi:DHA1 family multidrug resistance protein-like MFS transporter